MTSVRLLSGGAAQGLVDSVRPAFEAQTGCTIDGVFGAVGAMKARLLSGEPADLLILSRALINELARVGHAASASIRDIGEVPTAVAVRSGEVPPWLHSAGDLRAALRAADEIHFPDPELATAGIHFAKVMRDLGVWDELRERLRPAPNGATAMAALAACKSARPIGCTQATEILSTPGIVLAAPLPPGCALATTYTCAITGHAAAPEPAASLIALLTSDANRDARRALGFA
ncbi:molybdate ABC transporter substrate-binding protein [Reyranella soli]|uniref:Molybdate ABC transporter substrate-binding protein n=1 Tax=Reyranella soli TaxID=1230389 RepID=A0A512NP56_9HYPH|nr:substrate-binding domain-containing protein [Reyranella soli]GEP60704.1 molybdate ABC transporter substrate-binding protein [Reyranella soli]